MPKRRKLNAIERDGVNFVRKVVEHHNSIFNEIHRENDYGNDAFIELVDDEAVTGKCLLIQIKSGKSYNSKNSCNIPASADHFTYWKSHKLPVIGVVYDPSEECAYWTNISAFLSRNPLIVKSGPYTINFRKLPINKFDDEGYLDFFLPIFLGQSIILDFDRSVEFAMSDDFDMHFVGVKSLFYGYRNNEATWDIFETILKERPAEKTTGYLAYLFAHVPGHGDIFWHKNNVLNPEIQSSLKQRFKEYDKDILVPIIRLVDENGFERGSVGQSVYALIDLSVSDNAGKLSAIINDNELESKVRIDALFLYCFIEQEKAEVLLLNLSEQENDEELQSGSRGDFSPSPHNTPHAGPHGAFHRANRTVVG
jgi:hypothetical protein